jgi:hypothetical protein
MRDVDHARFVRHNEGTLSKTSKHVFDGYREACYELHGRRALSMSEKHVVVCSKKPPAINFAKSCWRKRVIIVSATYPVV